ncbi:MAG: hypothetical protein HYZ29_10880 [Myxococcales bacterium]|nr:hypothetical protein [Myxococcales bacterium]
MYLHYPSTFDPIHHSLACVADPRDPGQVTVITSAVLQMLAERVREETEGEGELRRDFAHERIAGSLDDLRLLRRRALKAGALPEFIALIDRVIGEADAACAVAPRRVATSVDAGPRHADWATVEVEDAQSQLPEFLRDI